LPTGLPRRRCVAISVAFTVLLALLAGCGSAQPPHLSLMPAPSSSARPVAAAGSLAWEVLPVAVPVGVDQPQWVVRTVDGSLAVVELERRIAPLGDEVRAAVTDLLPGAGQRSPASRSAIGRCDCRHAQGGGRRQAATSPAQARQP